MQCICSIELSNITETAGLIYLAMYLSGKCSATESLWHWRCGKASRHSNSCSIIKTFDMYLHFHDVLEPKWWTWNSYKI